MTTNAELMGQTLNDIADAIREKRDVYYDIPMTQMAEEIRNIITSSQRVIIPASFDIENKEQMSASITVNPYTVYNITADMPAAVDMTCDVSIL